MAIGDGYLLKLILLILVLHISGTVQNDSQKKCSHVINLATGTIMSPNYPSKYPVNHQSEWTFNGKIGQLIQLTFLHVDLENIGAENECMDWIKVYDGRFLNSTIIANVCGCPREMENIQFRSTSNFLRVVFESDGLISRTGFTADYWIFDCFPFTFGPDTCNMSCSCDRENSITCDNRNGSCQCKRGFHGESCQFDIDECSDAPSPCQGQANLTCVNIPGSYRCECQNGDVYSATGDCLSKLPFHCEVMADVIFVVDSSGSITRENYKKQLDFAANVVGSLFLSSREVRFGLVVFSTEATKWIHLGDYSDVYDLQRAILRTPHIEEYTKTYRALKLILDHGMFASGGRPEAPDVVITLTDGISDDTAQTTLAAVALKERGVTMFTVGITDQVNLAELLLVSSSVNYVIQVDNFDLLNRMMYPLMNQTCSALSRT
ncbi:Collagen alpha-4(VI) chain [Bulinus truncatus]|nr:Collagen alpha-4(VI) chain [Bulinus truncatus]